MPYFDVFPWRESAWDERMNEVLLSWLATPYCAGGSARGTKGGVDCVRFVACVLNDLCGNVRRPLPKLPRDTAFHSAKRAKNALRDFLRLYSPYEKVDGSYIESGDIIVVRPIGAAGPGHALIATPTNKALMHAGEREVSIVHIHEAGDIHAIFRPSYKEEWTR